MRRTRKSIQTARDIWRSLESKEDLHKLIRETPEHVAEILRFMHGSGDNKIFDLLEIISVWDRADIRNVPPWSVFKTSDLISALLDISLNNSWIAKPSNVPVISQINFLCFILHNVQRCASVFVLSETKEPYFKTYLSKANTLIHRIWARKNEFLCVPPAQEIIDEMVDAQLASSLISFVMTYVELLKGTREGEFRLRNERQLFGQVIVRAWTQTQQSFPDRFSHVHDIICSLQGTNQLEPFLLGVLDSQPTFSVFLDKIHLLLLDESLIDQELCDVIATLVQVMIALKEYGNQALGLNPRTTALLSSITSACQRQMCMGSRDPQGKNILNTHIQETLLCINFIFTRSSEDDIVILNGLISTDLIRLLAIIAIYHPQAQAVNDFGFMAILNGLLYRVKEYLAKMTPTFFEKTIIRYYLVQAVLPAVQALDALPPQPMTEHLLLGRIQSRKLATEIWHDLISQFMITIDSAKPEESMQANVEEWSMGQVLLDMHFSSAWSMKCHWSGCLCSYAFSTYTREQLCLPHAPWYPDRIRVPHRMKVCTGCWNVWYCGKNCQKRSVSLQIAIDWLADRNSDSRSGFSDWSEGGHREVCAGRRRRQS
ncbi:hypothetical protein QCA50_017377 [Cerrena zonata]|uniref:MYND-type domain-containing protein n=1 Tax=Cerrena zonata TaxID=2478898 RepID=A0AAW0FDN0_9APHY